MFFWCSLSSVESGSPKSREAGVEASRAVVSLKSLNLGPEAKMLLILN